MMFKSQSAAVLFFLLPIIIGGMYLGFRRKSRRLAAFIDPALWPKIIPSLSLTRRFWKRVMVVAAAVFLILAIMRPQYGAKFEQITRKGQDILIAIDTSLSMSAQDIVPSRMARAKQEVLSLVNYLNGDRLGVILFSGTAYVQTPLTLDYGAIKLFLDDIRVGSVPKPGTNLEEAIRLAMETFPQGSNSNKLLVVISDGETFEGDAAAAAKKAAQAGIRVYAIGIGSANGEPLPIRNESGVITQYKRDLNNQVVISKLNSSFLQSLTESTGGKLYLSTNASMASEALYRDVSQFEQHTLEDNVLHLFIDRFHYFLLISFLLLSAEFCFSERKQEAYVWKGRL